WRNTGEVLIHGNTRAPAGVALKNGFAIVGGSPTCGVDACRKVQYASFKPAGALHTETWTTSSGTTLPRFGSANIVYNGYIYVIGGCTKLGLPMECQRQNTGRYAAINADGSLGTWTTMTNTIPSFGT